MATLLSGLWHEEDGQDVIEYTLLMAFVALATCSFFGMSRESISGINNKMESRMIVANQVAGN